MKTSGTEAFVIKTQQVCPLTEPVIHILEEPPVFLTCPARSRMEISSGAILQSSLDTRVTAAPERLEQTSRYQRRTLKERVLYLTLLGQCAPRDGRTLRCFEGDRS